MLTMHKTVTLTANTNFKKKLTIGRCLIDMFDHDADILSDIHLYYNVGQNHAHLVQEPIVEKKEEAKEDSDLRSFLEGAKVYKLALEHSGKCPARKLRLLKNEIDFDSIEAPILFAACIVIVDKHDRILLTRREKSMFIFPSCWVAPGGHVDPGETIEEAAIREVHEETGLYIDRMIKENGDCVYYQHDRPCIFKPYYMYESLSKPLEAGVLSRAQHLIVFFYLKLNQSADEIILQLEPSEVDAAVWLSIEELEKVLNKQDGIVQGIIPKGKEKKVKMVEAEFELKQLFPCHPNEVGEGLGKGHFLALRHLQSLYKSKKIDNIF